MRQLLRRCRTGALLQFLVLGGALVLLDQGLTLYHDDEVAGLKRDTDALLVEVNTVENARDAMDLDSARMLKRLQDLQIRIHEDETELAVRRGSD